LVRGSHLTSTQANLYLTEVDRMLEGQSEKRTQRAYGTYPTFRVRKIWRVIDLVI